MSTHHLVRFPTVRDFGAAIVLLSREGPGQVAGENMLWVTDEQKRRLTKAGIQWAEAERDGFADSPEAGEAASDG